MRSTMLPFQSNIPVKEFLLCGPAFCLCMMLCVFACVLPEGSTVKLVHASYAMQLHAVAVM